MSGATGLEYSSLPIVAHDVWGKPEWPEIFESIRTMESQALISMRKK